MPSVNNIVILAGSMGPLVSLVYLVCSVYLVYPVSPVYPVQQPDRRDRPDRRFCHPAGRYRGNSGSISAKDLYARSFADKMGVAIGQGMARAGSFHTMPRSSPSI
jgi:hypothetical protein